MKLLYTHENKIIVENIRNWLQEEGLETVLKNEFSSGGMGELSPMETWPELWVSEQYFEKAKSALDKFGQPSTRVSWQCSKCGEKNEGAFEVCWQCQSEV